MEGRRRLVPVLFPGFKKTRKSVVEDDLLPPTPPPPPIWITIGRSIDIINRLQPALSLSALYFDLPSTTTMSSSSSPSSSSPSPSVEVGRSAFLWVERMFTSLPDVLNGGSGPGTSTSTAFPLDGLPVPGDFVFRYEVGSWRANVSLEQFGVDLFADSFRRAVVANCSLCVALGGGANCPDVFGFVRMSDDSITEPSIVAEILTLHFGSILGTAVPSFVPQVESVATLTGAPVSEFVARRIMQLAYIAVAEEFASGDYVSVGDTYSFHLSPVASDDEETVFIRYKSSTSTICVWRGGAVEGVGEESEPPATGVVSVSACPGAPELAPEKVSAVISSLSFVFGGGGGIGNAIPNTWDDVDMIDLFASYFEVPDGVNSYLNNLLFDLFVDVLPFDNDNGSDDGADVGADDVDVDVE